MRTCHYMQPINSSLETMSQDVFRYLISIPQASKPYVAVDLAQAGYLEDNAFPQFALVLKQSAEVSELRWLTYSNTALSDDVALPSADKHTAKITCGGFELSDSGTSLQLVGCIAGEKRLLLSLTVRKTGYQPKPVFVVGSPCSGTTAVGKALQRAFEVDVHNEAHIGDWMVSTLEHSLTFLRESTEAANSGKLIYQVSPSDVEFSLQESLRSLHRQFYGDDILLDKTPGLLNLKSLPFLLRCYPDARVIFCKRRGIENIISRVKKFTNVKFEGHCRQWRQTFRVWRQVQNQLDQQLRNKSWKYEAEQFELANRPAQFAFDMIEFLQLDTEARQRLQGFLTNNSPQSSSDYRVAVDYADLDWSAEQRATFESLCMEEMQRQGYALGSAYYEEK